MKKKILMGVAVALMCLAPSNKSNAFSIKTDVAISNDGNEMPVPDENAPSMQEDSAHRGHGKMDPAKMAKMRTQRMVKKYGLNDEQATKLLALNQEQMTMKKDAKVDFKNMTDEQREAMKNEMKEKRAKYETALKEIFTADQYKAYLKDKKKQQNRQNNMQEAPREGGPGNFGGEPASFGGGEN